MDTHARRTVDRLGDLLELAWMAEAGSRYAKDDSTAALLTAVAGYKLLPGENQFEHPIIEALSKHAAALIEERPVHADVVNL
jgi:hypothetical protein